MSNYQMVLDSRPDYFKMDSYFVNGVAADTYRQAILESVTLLARRFRARVIAEGVADAADLETLGGLGIDLVQGWLFSKARPAAEYGGGRVVIERILQRTAESAG
jgi:EAL domain-containing protein (putative c-di-GMP-specific phosphodiesterase class I)